MKLKRMSLANIQGKLSRADMKRIMAGSGGGATCTSKCYTSTGGKLNCIQSFSGCITDSNCSNSSTCQEP